MKSDKDISVNRLNANPQNGQTHSNDLPANSQRIGWVSDHFVGFALGELKIGQFLFKILLPTQLAFDTQTQLLVTFLVYVWVEFITKSSAWVLLLELSYTMTIHKNLIVL